jgi:hypothetical protein
MTHDLAARGTDPHTQVVADALVQGLGSDELSVWALVESSDGRRYMVLLIHDGAGPARLLFGVHTTGERSLPDRVPLEDLDRDTVGRAIETAYARAIQRGDAACDSGLRLVSTGTPTDWPCDDELDRAPATALGARRSPTGIS